ncbi:peptidase U32 [Spirochaeta thermophila DSM 6578]|uniref:Peptidase U32 n=1 Tax=Winmispira thermophila (strain ATCC 700085 / DSM 6578 / Z-1203) TaxID=869211 RepID=G0GFZ5_WINT7|nr:peptidase U32 family protein [Spirochaeta thermophila]AEJ62471.1 peptidase U32 [Spirochaeta thermophila DSM 6578]
MSTPGRGPEILAPAGSFAAGIHALEAGADALYVGLTRFSARAFAHNVEMEELSRLLGAAHGRGARLYVTLNTVIVDEELPEVARVLEVLALMGVDGIIVQDLGVVYLARTYVPGLEVHASTQMGIHSPDGARVLRDLGVRRAILARELALEEIAGIVEEVPELDYEVFVHGAMCYSISGMCLASGLLLGRSGNRGVCAQVCRTWQEGPRGEGYYFSMRDLAAGERVRELAGVGVRAFKIEGRMKSPEYVRAAVRWYRALLEGRGAEGMEEEVRAAFARPWCTGHLDGHEGLVEEGYPGHVGVQAGVVVESGDGWVEVALEREVGVRDGVGVVLEGRGVRKEGVWWGVERLEVGGRARTTARSGECARIPAPRPVPAGTPLRLVARHDATLPTPSPTAFPASPLHIPLALTLTPSTLTLTATLPFRTHTRTYPITLAPARTPHTTLTLIHTLLSSYAPPHHIPFSSSLTITSDPSLTLPLTHIFIPASELKVIRREFFSSLHDLLTHPVPLHLDPSTLPTPPPRRLLSPGGPLPFPTRFSTLTPSQLASLTLPDLPTPLLALPLPPTSFPEQEGLSELLALIERFPAYHFLIGLNNPAHILWARTLHQHHPDRTFFFIDYLLYCSNRATLTLLTHHIPHLLFAYPWIEDPRDQPLYQDILPPIFISRVRHTPTDMTLTQNHRTLTLLYRDGITYTIASPLEKQEPL